MISMLLFFVYQYIHLSHVTTLYPSLTIGLTDHVDKHRYRGSKSFMKYRSTARKLHSAWEAMQDLTIANVFVHLPMEFPLQRPS